MRIPAQEAPQAALQRRHRSAGARELAGLDAVAALRHARRVARLSQRDLARRARVSQSLIARIEARRVDPPVGVMQRLLGLCGMRWELQLRAAGVTPAERRARQQTVRAQSARRAECGRDRRFLENAAARRAAAMLENSGLTTRERRRRVRAVRLAERAAQADAYQRLVAADDEMAAALAAGDAPREDETWRQHLAALRVPPVDRLVQMAPHAAAADLAYLLYVMGRGWWDPRVALTGPAARRVWAADPPRHAGHAGRARVDLAPLRGRAAAVEFLHEIGARPWPGRRVVWQLGRLAIRLGAAPDAASVVAQHARHPTQGLAVVRPESPGVGCDRHAIRALLEFAARDRRGRRRPPYHEVFDGARRPYWIHPTGAPRAMCDVA